VLAAGETTGGEFADGEVGPFAAARESSGLGAKPGAAVGWVGGMAVVTAEAPAVPVGCQPGGVGGGDAGRA
jgi:hypothetical protein